MAGCNKLMPSKSKSQADFMRAAAHNPEFAKKAGISQAVAKDFYAAEKQRKMAKELRK